MISVHQTRSVARVVGSLFLIAMVASLAGAALVNPIIADPGNLTAISSSQSQLLLGVFLEILNGVAVAGIGILMFSLIKRWSGHLAAGYLGFRLIEAVFCCFIVVAPVSLLTISQEINGIQGMEPSFVGTLAVAIRSSVVDWLIPIFFALGALVLYCFIYQSRLLPRFISVWGLAAAGLIALMMVLMFLSVKINLAMNMVMAMPIILNEIFLGIWLIAKGFDLKQIHTIPTGAN
jgi:hypothetical protein